MTDDEDPATQSMRTVWLSMRDGDEEPPANGLAALMAAAREQADQMKAKPQGSWWRRMLAVMVRPPVLAMATIVVLVGGAVVLKNRSSDLDATSHPVPPEASPRGELRSTTTEKQEDAPPVEQGQLDGQGREVTRPGPTPKPATVTVETTTQPQGHEAPKPPPNVPDPTLVKEGGKPGGQSDGLVIADDEEAAPRPERPTVQPSDTAPSTGTSRTRANVVDQLVRQAETAAGRKDCAAVRATAQRIKKLDSTTYKSRVEKQAAIKSCLK